MLKETLLYLKIISQVKTASEMTYIVSSGALNSTPTNQRFALYQFGHIW